MASGPEHYLRAQALLAEITLTDGSVDFGFGDAGAAYAAAAQVHATLALAAATAMRGTHDGAMDQLDYEAWDAVCGVQDDDEEPGAETDGAVESTGHLPGYYDSYAPSAEEVAEQERWDDAAHEAAAEAADPESEA